MAAGSAGRIDLDLGLNYKQFVRQLGDISGNAAGKVGGAFKKLAVIIAGAFAVKSLSDFSNDCIKLASDLAEVQNVVNVTFGSMTEEVNNWAKNAITQFGLSELSAKKYASTMGAMLKSSGLTGKAMEAMSLNLAGLSADFASFYNLANDDAFYKIQSGISGETEPLKQLGINMNIANLNAYALSQGIQESYMKMTQAEQVLLRYNYLMSVSADAQGDFARTSTGWANQTRVLNEQFKIFKTTMGQGFINILTPILRGINAVIMALQKAAQYFKAFTILIFGESNAAGQGAVFAEDLSSGLGDAGTAMADVGKKAKKANKELQGSLSNFDELNVISQESASAAADAAEEAANGGAGGINPGLDIPTFDVPPIAPEVKIDMTKFQPLIDILNTIKQTAMDLGNTFLDIFGPPFAKIWQDAQVPIAGWKKALIETFQDFSALGEPLKTWFINDMIPFIQEEIRIMGEILLGVADSALIAFNGIREAAMPVLTWLVTDGLSLLTDFYTDALHIFEQLFDSSKNIFDTLWVEAVNPGLSLVSERILDYLNIIKEWWGTWGTDITDGLILFVQKVEEILLNLWHKVLEPIYQKMLELIKRLWDDHFKALVTGFLDFVQKLINGATKIFNEFITPLINWLIDKLAPGFVDAFNLVMDIVGEALGIIGDVAAGILKALGGVIDFVVGIFTGDWEQAWQGVQNIFIGIFDALAGIVKGAMNMVIDVINFALRGINKIKVEVPQWVQELTGMGASFGFNIKDIPRLAEGGLVSAPTLAMVGDNKGAAADPEVVSPLSKLQDMMSLSNQSVVEVLMMILEAIESKETTIDLDGEKLTKIMRSRLNIESGRVGKAMINIGGVPAT